MTDSRELAAERAEFLAGQEHYLSLEDTGEIFYYDSTEGIYKPAESHIAFQLEASTKTELVTNQLVNEVLGHIRRQRMFPRSIFENNNNPHLVLKDCLFNLETFQPECFSPDYYALNKMDVQYKPEIGYKNSLFWKFVNQILSEQDVQGIGEELGAILYQKYIVKKMSVYLGDTDTGKSTLLAVYLAFFGPKAVSSVPLQQLTAKDRFAVSALFYSMTNIVDDMPKDIVHSVGELKQLCGDSRLQGERKFHDPFFFVNHAYLISACNYLPPTEEDDSAFYNRIIIRTFSKKYGGNEKPDRRLKDKLTTPEELSAVLNFALEGLKRLQANGWNFSNTVSLDTTREFYRRKSDPIWGFVEDWVEVDPSAYEVKIELYNAFRDYCTKQGIAVLGKDYFYKNLPNYVTVTSERKNIKTGQTESRPHCFVGLRLRPLSVVSYGLLGPPVSGILDSVQGVQGGHGQDHLSGTCSICHMPGGLPKETPGGPIFLHPKCEKEFLGKV
jgi:putative DNA primase/helicase